MVPDSIRIFVRNYCKRESNFNVIAKSKKHEVGLSARACEKNWTNFRGSMLSKTQIVTTDGETNLGRESA